MTACTEPDCDRKVHARGLCHRHYVKARHAGALDMHELRDPSMSHPVNHDYDLAARVAALRLAVELARSRVAQALIVLQTPEVGMLKNVSPGELLDEALQALDGVAA